MSRCQRNNVSRRSSRPPVGEESWRLVVDNGRGLLGLRLAAVPLHRRAYRSQPGPRALHPPLAAAAALLAALHPGQLLVDPCCGSATIPVEAKLLHGGQRVVAADVNVARLSVARANVSRASVAVPLVGLDAAHLPFPNGSTQRVVTNPPRSRQVSWSHGPTSHAPLWLAISDALGQDGRAAVVTDHPQAHLDVAKHAALSAVLFGPIGLSGSLESVVIAAMTIRRSLTMTDWPGPNCCGWHSTRRSRTRCRH